MAVNEREGKRIRGKKERKKESTKARERKREREGYKKRETVKWEYKIFIMPRIV